MADAASGIRLLIVEDSEDDTLMVVHALRQRGFAIEWQRAESEPEIKQAIDDAGCDAVLCDSNLPGYGAAPAIALLRAADRHLPIILISGKISDEEAVGLIKSGADDYVPKDKLALLPGALDRALKAARQSRESERRERELSLLLAATRAVSQAESLGAALEAVLQAACEHSGWPIGQAWLPEEAGGAFRLSSVWHAQGDTLDETIRVAGEARESLSALAYKAIESRQVTWSSDLMGRHRSSLRSAKPPARASVGSAVAIPVIGEDEVIAVLEFAAPRRDRSDEGIAGILAAVAGQLGTLLCKKRADDALRESEAALREMNAVMEQTLRERDILLMELQHRVKNSLQVIVSLLNLRSDQAQEELARQAIREASSRVEALSLAYRYLYQPTFPDRTALSAYVPELCKILAELYAVRDGQVTVQTAIEPVAIPIGRLTPVSLILNELLSNAFKHAFPDGRKGSVAVGCRADLDDAGGQVGHLWVADDGIGLPAGFDIEVVTSTGLLILRSLVAQIEGRISVIGDCGTAIHVRFPLDRVESE